MKHIKIILLLIFYHIILISVFAQNPDLTTVKFSYDDKCNRIRRWIDITKIAIADTVDTLNQDSLIKKNITNSHGLDGVISLFPNPTEGLIDMKITGMKDGETAEYAFVSLTGQQLLRKKTGSPITDQPPPNLPQH